MNALTTAANDVGRTLGQPLAATRPVVVAFDEATDGTVRATVRSSTGAYTVNLSRHMVSLMESQRSTAATAAVIRASDELVGTSVNIVS